MIGSSFLSRRRGHHHSRCSASYEITLFFILVTCLPLRSPVLVLGQHQVTTLSGSGSSSQCIEIVMDLMEDRAHLPTRLTYRSIDTNVSEAQTEFWKAMRDTDSDTLTPIPLHFGSSYTPLASNYLQDLAASGKAIMHFPYSLSTVGLFHNIPLQNGTSNSIVHLNLTSCMIAQMFLRRNITKWNHELIIEQNPNLPSDLLNQEITIVRPYQDSHATSAFTQYLRAACPTFWPNEQVGGLIVWPDGTRVCEETTDMAACIANTDAGAIGFLDVSLSKKWSHNIYEVPLINKEGHYQTSTQSAALGGILAAAEQDLPASVSANFSTVTQVFQAGPDTWPLTVMNYVYVPKAMNHLPPRSQGLVVAFLNALYDPGYINQCDMILGVLPVPSAVRTLALDGIEELIAVNTNADEWIFETELGMLQPGNLVLSNRRQSFANRERQRLREKIDALSESNGMPQDVLHAIEVVAAQSKVTEATVTTLQTDVEALKNENELLTVTLENLQLELDSIRQFLNSSAGKNITRAPIQVSAPTSAPLLVTTPAPFDLSTDFASLDDDTQVDVREGLPVFTLDDQNHLQAALVLAGMSFTFWTVYFVWRTWRFFLNPWSKSDVLQDSIMYANDATD